MFENNEDLDLEDEFLNIAFENEEREITNKSPITGKLNTDTSVHLNAPPPITKLINNVKGQSDMSESLHSRCPFTLNSPESHFLKVNQLNSIQQGSSKGSFTPDLNHTLTVYERNLYLGSDHTGEKENKRKASPPPSRSKRERKFPGPAGLLPDRKSFRGSPLKLDSLPQVDSPSASVPDELCSQGRLSGSVLEEGPWQSLLSDLGPHADVLDIVNVASVKRKAAARCFVGRKVPFLAAALHHLDVSSADPCIILRDSTGEIHGTLHREVWQQFAAELVVGTVLVIRNVGLLSTGLSSRRHYLNITANNLATIYSANPEKTQKRQLHPLSSHDCKSTIEQWQSLMAVPRTVGSPASSLFNTPLSSPSFSLAQSSLISPHLSGVPQASNIRPTTSQITWEHRSSTGTPPYPRANPPSRPMGKNLFPSSSHSSNQNPIRTFSINASSPGVGKPQSGIANQTKPNVSRSTINNSFMSNSVQSSPTAFKFDPVMLKTKTFNNTVNAEVNFQNQSSSRSEYGKGCVKSFGNDISRVILSQSSQLTVEEQSVVENVFDGIDADSLFDDDF